VLWLSLHEGTIKPLSYRGHFDITLSDHKPVSAMLQVQVRLASVGGRAPFTYEFSHAGPHYHPGEAA
jgi:hypothetical protein